MKRSVFILLLICSVVAYGHDATIVVRNQQGFDRMDEAIREAAKAGKKDVLVKIRCGSYQFHEDHLTLKGLPDDISITISGKGRVNIYANGSQVDRCKLLSPDLVYYKKGNRTIKDYWSQVWQSDELVEVVDSIEKICRLKLISSTVPVSKGDLIHISQWFLTYKYAITDVRNGYAYFVSDNLVRCNGGKSWSVNYDFVYAKETPRYRIWRSKEHDGSLIEGISTRFLKLNNIKLKNLYIKGVTFCGNALQPTSALIWTRNVEAENITFYNCTFHSCHSACMNIGSTENVNISRCSFFDNLTTCIYSDGGCKDVFITDCLFVNNSVGWNNTFCINIKGKDFYVARNLFKDFGYGAIGIGEHIGDKKFYVIGVVESNEMYYTPSYYANYKQHTLMDSGVIYLWTQNDSVVIRNNYIHDYIGMMDNRGIFCDDGASNFSICDNTILNIANSYSIDSRRVKDRDSKIYKNNVYITISGNTVDGDIRFEGRDEDANGCVFKSNIIKANKDGVFPKMKVVRVN